MMRPTFNLMTDPWIKANCLDGSHCELGIDATIRRSHEIRRIVPRDPATSIGLHRLLLAVVHDRLELGTDEEWLELWDRGRLDLDPSEIADRFDLFEETYPFFQTNDPGVDRASVAYLVPQLPTADLNSIHTHAFEDEHALCPACCAHQLAALPATAFAGGSTTAEDYVKVEKKTGRKAVPGDDGSSARKARRPGRFGYKAGINGTNGLYVILQGDSLFQTLMWNYALPPARPPQSDPVSNRAVWAGDGTVGKAVALTRIGYARSLTILPRRVRLYPGDGGNCSLCGESSDVLVREMFYKPGEHRPEGTDWQDPMLAYELSPDGLRPVVARGNRPLWTDLARLALPLSGVQPASILTQSYRLVRETGTAPRPQVSYLMTHQARPLEWSTSTIPYTRRIASDEVLRELVRAELVIAEDVAIEVGNALKRVVGHRPDLGLFWAPLAKHAGDFVLSLEHGGEPQEVRERWRNAIRSIALDSFRILGEGHAGDGEGMARFVKARSQLRKALKKLVPAGTTEVATS
jgi:CRISPR type I-E-associated protein CasA/Cse1